MKGKRIAITGILNFYKREEAFSLIQTCGGIPQVFVTKDTDYLVVGRYRANSINGDKSNKRILAEKYIKQGRNIKIIREDEFLGMLWRNLTGKNNKEVKEHTERAGRPSCSFCVKS